MLNFTSIKKLKYLEISKYVLGIKYMIAQIKHSVDSIPIICWLLSDLKLLPAPPILATEKTMQAIDIPELYKIPGDWSLGPNLSLWI